MRCEWQEQGIVFAVLQIHSSELVWTLRINGSQVCIHFPVSDDIFQTSDLAGLSRQLRNLLSPPNTLLVLIALSSLHCRLTHGMGVELYSIFDHTPADRHKGMP
jgi:hypothetical protein